MRKGGKLKRYVSPQGGNFEVTTGSGAVEAVLMLLQETGFYGDGMDEVVDRILCDWMISRREYLRDLGIDLTAICDLHATAKRKKEGA